MHAYCPKKKEERQKSVKPECIIVGASGVPGVPPQFAVAIESCHGLDGTLKHIFLHNAVSLRLVQMKFCAFAATIDALAHVQSVSLQHLTGLGRMQGAFAMYPAD